MNLMQVAEFVQMFWMPFMFGAAALAGAVAGLIVRDSDAPWTGEGR